MCEPCDDDRVTVVIAGELPGDEPDNAAMIARDLSDIEARISALEKSGAIDSAASLGAREYIRKCAITLIY